MWNRIPLFFIFLLTEVTARSPVEVLSASLPNSYTVAVDTTEDLFPANSSNCFPNQGGGQCSLRSAILLCRDHLTSSTKSCHVELPVEQDISVNASQGEMSIEASEAAGSLTLIGNACRIYPILSEESFNPSRLFRFEATGSNALSIQIFNLTVLNFGGSSILGGAIKMQNLVLGLMQDISFLNNTGQSAGAVYINACPGFQILNCLFYGNSALNNGGGLFLDSFSSDVSLYKTTFAYNRVDEGLGGGLYIHDYNNDVSMHQCNFSFNYAIRGAGLNVNNDNVGMNITYTLFFNNSAYDRGGGLSISSFNYHFLMEHCILEKNSAPWKYGGAFYVYADNWYVTVSESYFTENFADLYGGAIDLYSNNDHVLFLNSKFVNNVAHHGGAGVDSYTDNDDMSFIGCDFIGNVAHIEGGGLFIGTSNDRYIIEDCNFWENSADSYGGSILLIRENYELVVRRCTFENSWSGSAGGVIHSALLNSHMQIEDCTFVSSSTRSYGGCIYFGEDHSDISLLRLNFTSNKADTGGAIYVSKFNTELILEDTVFHKNVAGYTGGAVISLSEYMQILNCEFHYNHAETGGAIHSVSGSIGNPGYLSLVNTSFVSNVAQGQYGAVFLEFCSGCVISTTSFRDNEALTYGALAISNCLHTSISEVSFLSNRVSQFSGALYVLKSENVTLSDSVFRYNHAQSGGAVHTQQARNMTILASSFTNNTAVQNAGCIGVYFSKIEFTNNEFFGNNATTGSGSAVYATASEVKLESNDFADNWSGHAGTVFWDYDSGMNEPIGLQPLANHFALSNAAVYGNSFATQGVEVRLSGDNNYTVVDYELPVPPISMLLVDYYNQSVLTESGSVIEATELPSYCYNLSPFITGGVTERFQNGVATFDTLSAFCAAGYNLSISFATELVKEDVVAVLHFRDCIRGEYFSERSCISCPLGSYSLVDPATLSLSELSYSICEQCPSSDVAQYCQGAEIVLREGHWRISTLTDSIIECPRDSPSCLGGYEASDASCGEGYHGPLCAVCDGDYYYASVTNTCEVCTSESSFVDPIFLVILILSVSGIACSAFLLYQKVRKADVQTLDDFVILLFFRVDIRSSRDPAQEKKRAILQSRSFRGHLKIYITYFQILATLPYILEIEFPSLFSRIISAASVFNLEISQSSLVSCSSSVAPDHIDILLVNTLYPFGLALLLYCIYKLHVYISQRGGPLSKANMTKISSRYFAALLTISYLILPQITAHILSTFNCVDVDSDNVVDGKNIYLSADLSISCTGERYRFALIWASVSIFVYPIGMPACYYYLLRIHKDDIVDRENPLPTQEEEEERSLRIRHLRLLYEFYKPNLWYFEVIETLLRLSVTGFLVLFGPGSSLQVSLGLLVALLYVNLYLEYRPFYIESLRKTKIVTLWQLYFVFFFAFVLRAGFVDADNLFVVVCFVLLIFGSFAKNIVDFILEQNQIIKNFRENVGRRLRSLSKNTTSIEMDRLFRDSDVLSQAKSYSEQGD